MVPPIPVGAVLRQRYVIQRILGQGGFGRTYLALDQERFNDLCVLKEFVVPYQDEAQVDKAKVLFQREANILYQIQHPQIPRFWGMFQEENRLFLVQDYIPGQTYRQILNNRKQQRRLFTEAEVLHFLQRLLPVLSYLHDREIIHRDITPENVILQTQNLSSGIESAAEPGLPVLVDFGSVKEATNYQSLMGERTCVGKVGYAPPEQLRTGTVYPNSDLYALAASSLVLLTGREPQTLLDRRTFTWNWESETKLSQGLDRILRKMLAFHPGDRYQTAQEVLVDLQLLQPGATTATTAEVPSASELVCITTGGRSQAFSGRKKAGVPHSSQKPIPQFATGSESSYSVSFEPRRRTRRLIRLPSRVLAQFPAKMRTSRTARLSLAAAGLVGLGIATPIAWRLLSPLWDQSGDVWISGARLSQSEASRIIRSEKGHASNAALKFPLGPPPDPGDIAKGTGKMRVIQIPPGEMSTVLQGNLPKQGSQSYQFDATEGQIVTVMLNGVGVTMNLLRSNQDIIDAAAYQTRNWTGQVAATDRYVIQVSGSGPYSWK